MAESRQHYNEDFKKKTVKYVQEQTKSLPEIAQELDIPVGTIRQWLSKYREFENEPMASIDRVRELEQLLKVMEQENVNLKEELAIVKKAVHIFSKPRS